MPAVKIGLSRQVVIPKKIHDELGLSAGDYLEVELRKGTLVLTPKTLADKAAERRLAESFDDFRHGRSHGPFDTSREAIRFLQTAAKKRKRNLKTS